MRTADDRVLAPARWTAAAVVPVLVAAFVILYLLPGRTMQLWSWMLCPQMSALILGGGYLSGAYFFARVTRVREWHRVAVGFVATTVFSSILLATTVLHWDAFNHDHVSFWAWLLLYAVTPPLLPILWFRNRRRDPRTLAPGDLIVPRGLRVAIGTGGAIQLGIAAVLFFAPEVAARLWPWELGPLASRSISAFVAFPAVTWLGFFFDGRWSSFRITQQTAALGVFLLGAGALRSQADFRSDAWFVGYLVALGIALVLNVALYLAMDRRARPSQSQPIAPIEPEPVLVGAAQRGTL